MKGKNLVYEKIQADKRLRPKKRFGLKPKIWTENEQHRRHTTQIIQYHLNPTIDLIKRDNKTINVKQELHQHWRSI